MTEIEHVLGLANFRVREMREPFEELGTRATLVTVDPGDGLRGYLSALSSAARRIERRESDAVLVYNGSGLIGVVGAMLSRSYGIPLLIRQNGDVLRQHREKVVALARNHEWRPLAGHLAFAFLTRTIFELADGFVPVTATLTDAVRRQTGCPTDRIAAAPTSIRAEEYAPSDRQRSGSPGRARNDEEGYRLLTVTNLNFCGKYEGVTELVDGVVPVLRDRPDVEYLVAGDGRYHDRLKRYLDDAVEDEVRTRIHAPGFVEDVASLYRDADVFLYASYIDAYPNVILESQAAGLPIVTNPAYGIQEQIEDGVSGRFVDPSDSERLARVVSSLLDDPAERRRLGRNARARVETENPPDVVAERLYDAIREVVSGGESDAPPAETTDRRPERASERRATSARGDGSGERGDASGARGDGSGGGLDER